LVNSGTPATIRRLTLNGDAVIGGSGRIDLTNDPNLFTSGTQSSYNLTKTGAAQFSIVSRSIFSNLGDINLQQGTLSLTFTSTIVGLGIPTKTLTIESGTTFNLASSLAVLNKRIISNGGMISASAGTGTNNTIAGQPITLNATTTFATSAS